MASANQTQTVSPLQSDTCLPFVLTIQQAPFTTLAVHSFAAAMDHKARVLIVAGLHTFDATPDNFPPQYQNTDAIVIDLRRGTTTTRSLASDPHSGLSAAQVAQLSVTAPEQFQVGPRHLYVLGGYGADTDGSYTTFPTLTRINVPKLIRWVLRSRHAPETAAACVRQAPPSAAYQVTGGRFFKALRRRSSPLLAVFGQDFEGGYTDGVTPPPFTQTYTQQVRRLRLDGEHADGGAHMRRVKTLASRPAAVGTAPEFNRRDLNVLPYLDRGGRRKRAVALSGVFTAATCIFTLPVEVTGGGTPRQVGDAATADADAAVFKQGSSCYICSSTSLYSRRHASTYLALFGGMTYQYADGTTSPEIPFWNDCTVVRRDAHGRYVQAHVPSAAFPTIASTGSNPGSTLLFGTAARFFVDPHAATVGPRDEAMHDVLDVDALTRRGRCRRRIGWIVGGIASTVPDTVVASDSTASPYVFEVFIERRRV